jgi:hypothetical protein
MHHGMWDYSTTKLHVQHNFQGQAKAANETMRSSSLVVTETTETNKRQHNTSTFREDLANLGDATIIDTREMGMQVRTSLQ